MHHLQKRLLTGIASFFFLAAQAQDEDLLKGIEDSARKEYVSAAYKSSRVIMSHSTEMLKAGVLDFRILHRFGNLNSGIGNFFGLDQATIRLGLDYGISDRLTIGLGRGSFRKELDGFLKYRLVQQSRGPGAFPLSIVMAAGSTLRTGPTASSGGRVTFDSRMAYFYQAILGRKLSDRISLQVMPTFLHRNLVEIDNDPHNVWAVGAGGRIKLSRRISFNFDYYYVANLPANRVLYHPLSVGFDIETGGHVFQLHFTNAAGMNERAFLTETTNNWGRGDIQFGFNISRAFQLKKKKG